MELVYLWIEEYKNIKNQGFNFSPRFKCHYDEKSNELTIDENKDYVHIFPENISITAIVGENGSGKSSILSKMQEYYYASNFTVCVIQSGKNLYITEDIENFQIINHTQFNRIKLTSEEPQLNVILHNNDILKNIPEERNTKSMDLQDLSNSLLLSNKLNISLYEQRTLLRIIKYSDTDVFQNGFFIFNPIEFSYVTPIDIEHIKLSEFITDMQKENEVQCYFLYFLYQFVQKEMPQSKVTEHIEALQKNFDNNYPMHFLNIQELFDYLNDEFTWKPMTEYALWFFAEMDVKDLKTKIEKPELMWELDSLIQLGFLSIELKDKQERQWHTLSQGERKIVGDTLELYDHIQSSTKNNLLILLDEPDLALHPAWQRRYTNEILKFFKHFTEKHFHIIITSHSPFILSDIPKENVIFLEKGKQVYPFSDRQQTFGANIHTLLSHGFFMEDGLMGEFAKSKIDKAIELLNKSGRLSKSSLAYCENIISIIGEPIIKKQLQRMLDSKRLSKIDEIDRLKADMAEIHQKIKRLEGRK